MGGRRATEAEKSSALSMYRDGVFITEIAMRTGFGTTTIYRWALDAGAVVPFSERLATGSTKRQFGRDCIGKKNVFHTSKGNRWIHTDSTFEYARLDQLENVESVVSIDRCGDRVPYEFGGKTRTYIPDFKLVLNNGLVIVEEIKPKRWVMDEKVRAKALAAEAHFGRMGIVFRVITEDEIGSDRLIKARNVSDQARSPEAAADAIERRKEQRRKAEANQRRKFKDIATPEQMADRRAKFAAYARAARQRKKLQANTP